jgi:hypothetical protein
MSMRTCDQLLLNQRAQTARIGEESSLFQNDQFYQELLMFVSSNCSRTTEKGHLPPTLPAGFNFKNSGVLFSDPNWTLTCSIFSPTYSAAISALNALALGKDE